MNDKDRAIQAITLIGEGIKKTRDQIITAMDDEDKPASPPQEHQP